MHDCPRCNVPLHGHEEFCPSCGEKQYVKPEYRNIKVPKTPPFNFTPLVVAVVLLLVVGFFAAQGSWVGELLNKGVPKEDPLDKLTPLQARQMIEDQISQALTAVGAPVKISYKAGEKPADKNADGPLEMTIDTKLADPNQRKAVIDPIKQYMDKAKIPTLIMHDAKSRATWTYSVSLSSDNSNDLAPAP